MSFHEHHTPSLKISPFVAVERLHAIHSTRVSQVRTRFSLCRSSLEIIKSRHRNALL